MLQVSSRLLYGKEFRVHEALPIRRDFVPSNLFDDHVVGEQTVELIPDNVVGPVRPNRNLCAEFPSGFLRLSLSATGYKKATTTVRGRLV